MDKNTLILLIGALMCSVSGQLMLKSAAGIVGAIGSGNLNAKLLHLAVQPYLWLGLGLYAVSALGYIIVLSRTQLSIAAPLIAISYIFLVLAGGLVFGEVIPVQRWAGVGLIMAGVILILGT